MLERKRKVSPKWLKWKLCSIEDGEANQPKSNGKATENHVVVYSSCDCLDFRSMKNRKSRWHFFFSSFLLYFLRFIFISTLFFFASFSANNLSHFLRFMLPSRKLFIFLDVSLKSIHIDKWLLLDASFINFIFLVTIFSSFSFSICFFFFAVRFVCCCAVVVFSSFDSSAKWVLCAVCLRFVSLNERFFVVKWQTRFNDSDGNVVRFFLFSVGSHLLFDILLKHCQWQVVMARASEHVSVIHAATARDTR